MKEYPAIIRASALDLRSHEVIAEFVDRRGEPRSEWLKFSQVSPACREELIRRLRLGEHVVGMVTFEIQPSRAYWFVTRLDGGLF